MLEACLILDNFDSSSAVTLGLISFFTGWGEELDASDEVRDRLPLISELFESKVSCKNPQKPQIKPPYCQELLKPYLSSDVLFCIAVSTKIPHIHDLFTTGSRQTDGGFPSIKRELHVNEEFFLNCITGGKIVLQESDLH